MKFDEQYEKLLNHYISEGIGAAIKDTFRRNFVDPAINMNPWRNERGNWAQDSLDKKQTLAELDPKQQGKAQAQGSNNSKYIESYKQTQLKSTITYNKEISFIDRGTVLGQFKFNCNDFITRKINININ